MIDRPLCTLIGMHAEPLVESLLEAHGVILCKVLNCFQCAMITGFDDWQLQSASFSPDQCQKVLWLSKPKAEWNLKVCGLGCSLCYGYCQKSKRAGSKRIKFLARPLNLANLQ